MAVGAHRVIYPQYPPILNEGCKVVNLKVNDADFWQTFHAERCSSDQMAAYPSLNIHFGIEKNAPSLAVLEPGNDAKVNPESSSVWLLFREHVECSY